MTDDDESTEWEDTTEEETEEEDTTDESDQTDEGDTGDADTSVDEDKPKFKFTDVNLDINRTNYVEIIDSNTELKEFVCKCIK